MKNVYVIGSLSKGERIQEVAEMIKINGDFDVRYVRRQPTKTKELLIRECFSKIEKADVIVAVEKARSIFGDGTMYELEYARRCGKKIVFDDGGKFGELFIQICLATSEET